MVASAEFYTEATKAWSMPNEEVLLVSDDPISDLGGGKVIGFQTAFVTTGKYDTTVLEELENKPSFVFSTLDEALKRLESKLTF